MATANQTGADQTKYVTGGAVIRVEEIHKYYELGEARVHALRGVSLDIHRGEFVALMGASGSGKSTFMNILGCLDKASSGRYLLEGTDVSQHDKKALALKTVIKRLDSYSRVSTCWPAPQRLKIQNCRRFTQKSTGSSA
jgi:ABC-type glutathione transport system ATPase component